MTLRHLRPLWLALAGLAFGACQTISTYPTSIPSDREFVLETLNAQPGPWGSLRASELLLSDDGWYVRRRHFGESQMVDTWGRYEERGDSLLLTSKDLDIPTFGCQLEGETLSCLRSDSTFVYQLRE